MDCILSTTYFGPVQWYQKLYRYERVLIERHETFQKQTYRNRCMIATTQGVQALTVPVVHGKASPQAATTIADVRISEHGNWRRLHWQAVQSAYGESPFFEYYEDDVRPFFEESRWEFLTDYNEAIRKKMCELIDIHPSVSWTTEYMGNVAEAQQKSTGEAQQKGMIDFRDTIRPKHAPIDPEFSPLPYYQVFRQKHGFLPNLSILDILFNMGPETIFYL